MYPTHTDIVDVDLDVVSSPNTKQLVMPEVEYVDAIRILWFFLVLNLFYLINYMIFLLK